MASRLQQFHATIRKQGPNPYVEVPRDVSQAFGRYAHKGHVRVHGNLNDAEIRGNLVPRSTGHWLFLHGGMRAAARVAVGDKVRLKLRASGWDDVPVPSDVKAALGKAGLETAFAAMPPDKRHELLRWVEIAETRKKRATRLAQLVAQLVGEPPPVTKGRAALRESPLWICPKCEHAFVNVNQWHSCKRYTLEQTFETSTPEIRALFDTLVSMIEEVGPVRVQAYRDHAAFLVRVRFIGATPKKRWLDVAFWLPRRIDSPRFRKVETLTPLDHIHVLRVTDAAELDDEVMGWIRAGYAVGEQRHLG